MAIFLVFLGLLAAFLVLLAAFLVPDFLGALGFLVADFLADDPLPPFPLAGLDGVSCLAGELVAAGAVVVAGAGVVAAGAGLSTLAFDDFALGCLGFVALAFVSLGLLADLDLDLDYDKIMNYCCSCFLCHLQLIIAHFIF